MEKENCKQLIVQAKEELSSYTKARNIIKWAVKNEVNKFLSLAEFKTELLSIGINYKKLKPCQDQVQEYNEELSEVRVRGVSIGLRKQLINISKNIGVDLSDLLKPKLREIADGYPAHFKIERKLD